MSSRLLALPLVLGLLAGGCDNDPTPEPSDAPVSDYDALFDGVPSNAELPFQIKADGPPPRRHTDLLAWQSAVKSQGKRGVCSIFSTTALMEHLYLKAGMDEPDFSEQYLQWSVKFEVHSFPNSSGSNAHYNLRAINQFGIPAEDAWPYEAEQWNELDDPECAEDNDAKPTLCYTNGHPSDATLAADKFHLPPGRWINSRREAIMDHIRINETGVVVGLDFFYQAWNHRKSELPRNLDMWDAGVVVYPNDEDIEVSHENRAGHSILLVGWDLDATFPRRDADGQILLDDAGQPVMETGFFIFKNSWGTAGFGIDNEHGAGYGYISMRYVEEHGSARVADVPDFVPPPPPGDDDGGADDGGDGSHVDPIVLTSEALLSIPDNDPQGVSSVLSTDETDLVGSVTVDVEITHTFRGDLRVTLIHDGTEVVLHNRDGGSNDDLTLSVTLDDFAGQSRDGDWTLQVVDTARIDTGTLQRWSVTLD